MRARSVINLVLSLATAVATTRVDAQQLPRRRPTRFQAHLRSEPEARVIVVEGLNGSCRRRAGRLPCTLRLAPGAQRVFWTTSAPGVVPIEGAELSFVMPASRARVRLQGPRPALWFAGVGLAASSLGAAMGAFLLHMDLYGRAVVQQDMIPAYVFWAVPPMMLAAGIMLFAHSRGSATVTPLPPRRRSLFDVERSSQLGASFVSTLAVPVLGGQF